MKQRYGINAISRVQGNSNGGNTQDFRIPSKKSIFQFIWSNESNEFLGRTALSWVKILGFYVIFYSCLVAYSAALYALYYQSLNERSPKYTDIINNPGISYRPYEENDAKFYELLLSPNDTVLVQKYVAQVDDLLEDYATHDENRADCDFDAKTSRQACTFNATTNFGPCTKANNYGLNTNSPCIFFKINKIHYWRPEFYDESDEKLSQISRKKFNASSNEFQDETHANVIWLSCKVRDNSNDDKIESIEYYPRSGFPGYYYPFHNQKGYLPPLVAVQLKNVRRNVSMSVYCTLLAKNIQHDSKERRGATSIKILIK